MAADDFEITPQSAQVLEPIYSNIITKSYSQKKEYMNLATTPLQRIVLFFNFLSTTDFQTIFDHYNGRYGGYDIFDWKSANIPVNVKTELALGAADLSGRWVGGSFIPKYVAKLYNVEITFERAV